MAILIITWIIAGILACILWFVDLRICGLLLPLKEQLKEDLMFLLFLIITGYFAFLVTLAVALGNYICIDLKRDN